MLITTIPTKCTFKEWLPSEEERVCISKDSYCRIVTTLVVAIIGSGFHFRAIVGIQRTSCVKSFAVEKLTPLP